MSIISPVTGREVLTPEQARKLYEGGSNRWRNPFASRRDEGPGKFGNVQDQRGVRAAFQVWTDVGEIVNGHYVFPEPPLRRAHMDAGLLAIQGAGMLPLSLDFQEGYQRIADMISDVDDYDQIDK